MKKITFLFVFIAMAISCNSLDQLLELKVDNDLTESIDVHVDQTNGAAFSFDLSTTANLNSGEFAQYKDKISAIKINKLTYKFKEFTGNSAGTIPSGTIKFDDIVLGTFTDFNISQAAKTGTIFDVADATTIGQIQTALLNNNEVSIKLSGNVLSDAGVMDFKIEVFMNMTATIAN